MESSTYKINVLSNLAKTRYLSFRRKGKIYTTKITQPRLKDRRRAEIGNGQPEVQNRF